MNNVARLVLEASKQFDNFVRNAGDPTITEWSPKIKAIVAPSLGLVKDGSDYKFDVNSKVADVIFNAMDANNYKGTVKVDLTVDPKKTGVLTVMCDPKNDKISATVSAKLTPGVNSALKKLSEAPPVNIPFKEIVSAWN